LIPDLDSHIKNYKPKRFDGDEEELPPEVDRIQHMIRSRAGGSHIGGSRIGNPQSKQGTNNSQINDGEYDDEEGSEN